MHHIGRQDNFFELGGHSLLALQLMHQIERRFGRTFRLATLFDAPTVADFAALLTAADDDQPATCAVAIKAGGNRAPLFFVSGWGGAIIGFSTLAKSCIPSSRCMCWTRARSAPPRIRSGASRTSRRR